MMNTSFELGQILELDVDTVAHGGDGVGRVSGMVCFVPGAFPGDKVRAKIYRCGKRAVWADLVSVVSPAPCRDTSPVCAERPCASACAWQAFTYPAQAEWKQRIVSDCLERIGGIQVDIGWLEQEEYRLAYRTRATVHGNGETVGYYAQRTHEVLAVDACPLNHSRLNEALRLLQMPGIRGDIQVTVNPEKPETLVFLREEASAIRQQFPQTNTRRDRSRFQFLYDGVPVVNGAFSQASLLLNRMLRAHTDACIGAPASLLDLYCGNGNLSLHHADACEVLGVDHDAVVVNAAAALAPRAFVRGTEKEMVGLLKKRPWEVILVDPPRSGAHALTGALAAARARKIVYVSCDPATLARDLRDILAGDWSLTQVNALDLFPHTPHVETVCVLER